MRPKDMPTEEPREYLFEGGGVVVEHTWLTTAFEGENYLEADICQVKVTPVLSDGGRGASMTGAFLGVGITDVRPEYDASGRLSKVVAGRTSSQADFEVRFAPA